MGQFELYVALLGLTIIIGVLFRRLAVPLPLLLVIAGMLLSLIPNLPRIDFRPNLILNIFLPMLVYTASAELSWKDVKLNMRPILMLSIGHVFFITALVAVVMHHFIPAMGWARAIILGAIVSPPDDVAILAIADKVALPSRVVTILKGESLLNDAAALTIFRFGLGVLLTHEFIPFQAAQTFFLVIVGESLYGFLLGHLMGRLRLQIKDPILQVMASFITPFIAYLLPVSLGGSGVLATVVTGFVIGHVYLERFEPSARLLGLSLWRTLSFALQSLLFLLVGLDLRYTLQGISPIPMHTLVFYSLVLVATVILGRFIWVFPAAYMPRLLLPKLRKKDPYPPWQVPFVISWAGMRGGISLAAALALPILPTLIDGIVPRDFMIFLVFSVIMATLLLQGLSLPWLLRVLGMDKYGKRERFGEHLMELEAKIALAQAVISWLFKYRKEAGNLERTRVSINIRIKEYRMYKKQLSESLASHKVNCSPEEEDLQRESTFLTAQIVDIERTELMRLWRENKINHGVRGKLLQQLDYFSKHISG